MDLEEATAKIADLETRVQATSAEADAARQQAQADAAERDAAATRLAELEPSVTTLQSEAETARTAAGHAQAEALGNLRRAILAENAGQVVPELVRGDTAEQLQASVDVAKAAFGRASEAARQQLAAQQVPGATTTRDAGAAAAANPNLSPVERIASGLASR